MLSRIAQELFWLGRNVARAEHTARMLDGVFQASLQSAADDEPRSAASGWAGARSSRSWAPSPTAGRGAATRCCAG